MPTFSDIQHEIQNVLTTPDEELTDEQRKLWSEYMEFLGNQEAQKADDIVGFINDSIARAEYLESQAKLFKGKATAIRNKVDRLKKFICYTMQSNGLKKVSGRLYSMSVRTMPSVRIDNEQIIPKAFWRTKVEETVNKEAIKAALKEGAVVPGASIAHSHTLLTR